MERLTSALTRCIGSYSRFKHLKTLNRLSLHTSSVQQYKWEPDNLKIGPDIPEYDRINIVMKGYNFPELESYAKYVHKSVINMDIESESWPVPPQKGEIQTLQFNTNKVLDSCKLNLYERVVQLQDCPSPNLPILLELITNHVPQGVEVTLKEHTEEDEEYLYVPDYGKLKLQEKLEELHDN